MALRLRTLIYSFFEVFICTSFKKVSLEKSEYLIGILLTSYFSVKSRHPSSDSLHFLERYPHFSGVLCKKGSTTSVFV